MTDEQKYVTQRWELVHLCDGSYPGYPRGTVLLQDAHGHWLDFPTFAAAKAFTEQRKQDIEDVEDEIQWLEWPSIRGNCPVRLHARLMAVEQDRLKALKQGMVAK
jgi:hypothetical protein